MSNMYIPPFEKYLGIQSRGFRTVLALFAFALLTSWVGLVDAQTAAKPNVWKVTISDSLDPVPSGSLLTYKIAAKNDGPVKSTNIRITINLPAAVGFRSCKTSYDKKAEKYCLGFVNGQVVAMLPEVKAHRKVTVTVVVKAPVVGKTTRLPLRAKAEGKRAFKGDATEQTTILKPYAIATLLPSGRKVRIRCGKILNKAFFRSDTIMQLNHSLGCTKNNPAFGLKIAKSGVTLNLQGKKIVARTPHIAGTTGLMVQAGVTEVTIDGGGTKGISGIELFDWCVRARGGNKGLRVNNLRCYKARSAALDIESDNVTVSKLKIDSTTPTLKTTRNLPGGVGLYAHGDNIHIKDTIVRRSKLIGILADGVDADLSGYATTIDGNTRSSIVEKNAGIGVVLQNGPHFLKDTAVYGDGPDKGTSTDGVVIAAGMGNRLDGVVVKKFNGNGVIIDASDTIVEATNVDKVSQNGFVISTLASNVILNNNSSKNLGGNGFVVEGDNNRITTGEAEENLGHGFQVNGNSNLVENSSAQSNGGGGFEVAGDANRLAISEAEKNLGHGVQISGDGNQVENNKSQGNSGVGFVVAGSANQFITNKAEKNFGNGFRVSGNDNQLINSRAQSNSNVGFVIAGNNTICSNNLAQRNSSYEWIISANNIDQGSNSANGERVSFTKAGGVFE